MNSNIITAITNTVKAIPGIPVVAEENTSFKPTLLTPWVRITVLPAEPSQVTIGYNRQLRFSGLVQIDHFSPSNSNSEVAMVDTIVDYFNHKDNRFIDVNGNILTVLSAWRGVGVTGTDWYRVPSYVRYETFSQ